MVKRRGSETGKGTRDHGLKGPTKKNSSEGGFSPGKKGIVDKVLGKKSKYN